jgi:peptidoglycan/LPS O-acetylase OafA/YrhL
VQPNSQSLASGDTRNTLLTAVRTPSHLARIDVLRGVAILSVIAFHFLGATFGVEHPGFHDYLLALDGVKLSWWLFTPFAFGWSGVALFFVISGYVIHRSYLLSDSFSWSGFAGRRFWRLYPAYLILLIVFTYHSRVSFFSKDFILHLFLLNNISNPTFYGRINGVFWSLAVECQLYVLYPLAIIAYKRSGWGFALGLSFVAATVWLVIAYVMVRLPPDSPQIWFSPVFLWPTWLIGAVIAEKHIRGSRLFESQRIWIISMAILCAIACSVQIVFPLAFHFASFAWAGVIDAYAVRKSNINSFGRLIASIGVISYSVYIIHQPLIYPLINFLERIGIQNPPFQIILGGVLFLPIIYFLGWISYMALEQNGIQLGKRLSKAGVLTRYAAWLNS